MRAWKDRPPRIMPAGPVLHSAAAKQMLTFTTFTYAAACLSACSLGACRDGGAVASAARVHTHGSSLPAS